MSEYDFKVKNGLSVSTDLLVANSSTSKVGIKTTNPTTSFDINTSDALKIPAGGSGGRPGIAANGMIRYNSDLSAFEGVANNTWMIITQAGANLSSFSELTTPLIKFESSSNNNITYGANSLTINVGGSSAYYANSTTIVIKGITANSSQMSIGANVVLSQSTITVGNTTFYSTQNSNSFKLANSTANIIFSIPTTTQISSGSHYLNANGSYVQITQTPSGSNTQIQFNDSQTYAGSAGLTFNKTSNTLSVSNTIITTTINTSSITGLTQSLQTSNTIDQSIVVNKRFVQNPYAIDGSYGVGSFAQYYTASTKRMLFEHWDNYNRSGNNISYAQLTLPSSGGAEIWHSMNDGSGSGLDADLLDGQDSSYYTNITARLGWTPVRQGGGPSQDANKTIMMGADNTNVLRVSINGTDYGAYWPMNVTGTATNITAYTINQNLGSNSSPTFNQPTFSGGFISAADSSIYRAWAPTTGVLSLNQAGTRYLYNNGSSYELVGQELFVNGATALTDNNISQRGISVKQTLTINKPNSTYGNYIYGTTNGIARWTIAMGEWSVGGETGGNVGSDFTVSRYSDAGNWLGFIIESKRNSGDTYYGGGGGSQHIFNARLYDGVRAVARDSNNGGIIELEKPSVSTLSGNVSLEQYGNFFRILERGGSFRGAYLDMAATASACSSRIWHSDSCYISPWQTITNGGGYTLAHGLGRIPKIIVIEYECINAEYGFSPGHNIMAPVGHAEYGVGSGPQPQTYGDTYINFRMGNYGVRILDAGTGAVAQATAANWKWRCYAWG